MLRAQSTTPVLGTVSGVSSALAINSNNSAGQNYNAVLNSDSSVSLLQNGAILSGQGCPAFSGLSSGIGSGAVYVDSAHNNIYLAMLSGVTLYAAYETIGLGTCTQGPLLQLTTNALSNLEMNVDPVQGNVYILNSFGAFPDALYILPIASWSASSATKLNMDYSVPYGPIVIDPSNDVVYINDLGASAYGPVGTYGTSGFFVYDPNYSATPANKLQHVVGYNTSGGTTPTPFNVGTLLSNGSGELVLVNENPGAISGNLSVPITILNTTAPQSLFFTNTTNPNSYNNNVDITPGAGLSTISAVSQYRAIGGADINSANNVVYVFGYNPTAETTPGLLLEYNLSAGASTPETVLSSSTAMPNLGYSAPWSRMNYDPESTELALSTNGALAFTSPLCAGTPLSLTQVAPSTANPSSSPAYPVVNATSGYVYAIDSGGIDFVAPPSGCTASTPIQISPATLFAGFPDESYFQNFTATGGSGTGYVWSIISGGTALTNLGLSFSSGGDLSGYPNATGTFPFTVQVVDSLSNSATQSYTLTIYPGFTVLPTSLPAGAVGTPYSQTLTASGGAGSPFTFSVISGTALSAVGLTLSSGGLISGTPSATETAAPLTIKVADSLGYYTELNYTLTINSASSGPITINDPETVTVNDSLTQVQLVDVSDPEAITVTDIAVVTVSSPLAITGPASLPLGTLNVAYTSNASTTMTASGGTPPYNWTATGLPPGLSIGATSGTISGTPTAAGSATVVVTVTDSSSNTATKTYSLAVNPPLPPLAITSPSSLPNADLNASYSETLGATGGLPPYIWTATGLPAGLAISTGGVLSGTPAVAGVFPVTVTVTDSANNTNSVIYSLTVVAPGLGISASPPTLTIVQGQSGQTTITFTPVGGYPGPVTLSCTGLPANTLCSFTLLPSGTPITSPLTFNGQQVMVLLTIQTDVGAMATVQPAPAPTPLRPGAILTAIAFWFPGSMLGVIALRRKRKLFTKNPRSFGLCLCVLLVGTLAGLAGCISGGGFGTYVTPAGTSTVTVVATPGSGSPVTVNIGLTITQQ
ncbi:MAG: putative Ig domain-containing protein [Terracidiphilus sp.]|jgi:hypothetical protein